MRTFATLVEAAAATAIFRHRQGDGTWVIYEPGDTVPPALLNEGFRSSRAGDILEGIENHIKLLDAPPSGEPLVVDAAGKVLLSLDASGGLAAKALTASGLLSSGAQFEIEEFDGTFSAVMLAVTDSNDRCALVITDDGTIDGSISAVDAPAPVAPVNRRDATQTVMRCEINHFLINGQSLSVAGENGVTTFDATDYRFSNGMSVRIEDGAQTLVPLANDSTHGILFGAVNQLKFLAKGTASYTADAEYTEEYKTLASGHGFSGQAIDALKKGGATGAYEDGMFQVDEGVRLAGVRSYCVPGVLYIQNHANSGSVPTTYRDTLIQLKNDYATDIMAKTGQTVRPKMLVYQSVNEQAAWAGTPEYEPKAAHGTIMASEVDPEIVLIGPAYWVAHQDGVHFPPAGYSNFGQLAGKVLYKICYRGENWKPLQPTQIIALRPDVLFIRFNVPEPPLVIDTTLVTDPGDYGFDVRDDTGSVGIAGIALVGKDGLRISLDRSLAANPTIGYAWYSVGGTPGGPSTGPRGNLRDSDAAIGWFRPAVPLYNWCVRFKKSIPYTAS